MNDEREFDEIDMDEPEMIELTDENGDTIEAEVLDIFEYEQSLYMILLPDDGEDGVVIMEVEESGEDEEEDSLRPVGDPELLDILYDQFQERNKELFDFEGDEE